MTMRAGLITAAVAFFAVPWPAAAQTGDPRALFEALRLGDVIEIMRREGLAYGESIEDDLFPGQGGAVWEDAVARIYTGDRMEERVADDFAAALGDADIGPAMAFFTSDRGKKIISLEIDARSALEDEAVETAARAAVQDLPATRLDRIESFIESNDLVEQNVTGTMNANYAFYEGLAEGGALLPGLTEDQMIADVWAQEPEIRSDTRDWLMAYLGLAYQPLDAAAIDAYIAFSRSPAGRTLNRAIFAAFDGLYNDISRDLGVAAAGFMQGEDI